MTTSVRRARPADAAAITRIYGEGIRARTATVLTAVPSADAMVHRISTALPEHAWLVAERSENVVGWAATMPYLLVSEYSGVAEFSVYVSPDEQGAGVGRLLMETLMDAAEQAGLHKMTSRVFANNVASRALLARLGFREVGTYLRHVRMDGEWRDVVVVEALLGEAKMDTP